jgi:hypothetical protein
MQIELPEEFALGDASYVSVQIAKLAPKIAPGRQKSKPHLLKRVAFGCLCTVCCSSLEGSCVGALQGARHRD